MEESKRIKMVSFNPALFEQEELARLGDSVAIRAECQGVPVYAFGYTYIYGVSPDFVKDARMQLSNFSSQRKIKPKKSWEITENKLGATPPREPRTARTDPQPFLGINLIDGDPETYWCSRPQNRSDVEPVWVRIDLAVETQIKVVVIVPREDNYGMPTDFCIKVSRDGWHWDVVYDNPNYEVPKDTKPRGFSFGSLSAKQILIIARKVPLIPAYKIDGGWGWPLRAFSVAEVQVIDTSNENVASISRGAGVTVSSCDFGITSEREMHQMLWSTHLDLGFKWVRVGYASPEALNWNFVERVKGKYEIDPETDRSLTQLVENGITIVLGLGFTNWLYTSQGHRDPKSAKQMWEGMEPKPELPSPDDSEMLEGYKNFVRFMVRHFKDRVKYYEIWNAGAMGYGWGDADPKLYNKYVKEAITIIREEYPDAKIMLGSAVLGVIIEYLKAQMEDGLPLSKIDVIGWHPCYSYSPNGAIYQNYPKTVKEIKSFAESHGFRGEYMATEWSYFAPYPVPGGEDMAPEWNYYQDTSFSEIVKAKHAARYVIMNVGLGVHSFWNETWNNHHIDRDVGLFRNTFSSDPISPTQPQAIYYVMRTLSTVLEAVLPAEMAVSLSNTEHSFEQHTFKLPKGDHMLAIWLGGCSKDKSEETKTDISFPGFNFKRAVGIDVLNGTEQELIVSIEGNCTVLKDMLIKDYPMLIKLIQG